MPAVYSVCRALTSAKVIECSNNNKHAYYAGQIEQFYTSAILGSGILGPISLRRWLALKQCNFTENAYAPNIARCRLCSITSQ